MDHRRLAAAMGATWPPAETTQLGPVTLRRGLGGGARVSCATASQPPDAATRAAADAAMRAMGQTPLWQITPGQTALDTDLAEAGFLRQDETLFLHGPAAPLAALDLPPITALRAWPMLTIQREIWHQCGVDTPRLAVMARAPEPCFTVLGRIDDTPAGSAFVALSGDIAAVHALHVLPARRRKGLARWMMVGAARWALRAGAQTMALAVTAQNTGARALYGDLGFTEQPGYHYRRAPDA